VTRDECNGARHRPGRGHYESWFQRANHPTRPLAFWIRYTLFEAATPGSVTEGELWAIWFDGERRRVVAVREEIPFALCAVDPGRLDVRLGSAVLRDGRLEGAGALGDHAITWSLDFEGSAPPLLLLPAASYGRAFPRAKALVGTPDAVYRGEIVVDGERNAVEGWPGSQNHNWGSRHTDRYVWGQVTRFDGRDGTFLECATAQLRLGPLWTPPLTIGVVEMDGVRHELNALRRAALNRGRVAGFRWDFRLASTTARVSGWIEAPAHTVVPLRYRNPPGGSKLCLNSKIAAAEVRVRRPGRPEEVLRSAHGAALEVLTELDDPRVASLGVPPV